MVTFRLLMVKVYVVRIVLVITASLLVLRGLQNKLSYANYRYSQHDSISGFYFENVSLSHPLENSCKYPILEPEEPTITGYFFHPRKIVCDKKQYEFTTLDENGNLYVHEDIATLPKYRRPLCYYRPFDGATQPIIVRSQWTDNWIPLKVGPPNKIPHDQFAVKCFNASKVWEKYKTFKDDGLPDDNKGEEIYHFAYAQLSDKNKEFTKATVDKLNLDILIIDSTSLNAFRRHMTHTWPYMKDVMGFEWLEGYNKVADNSMVNLMPVLAGQRYVNQSADFPSDILPHTYNDSIVDLDSIDFVWNKMKDDGCVTMWNDDVGHYSRGLFHYPWRQAKGWKDKPTDYYYRPWHVYNYRYLTSNSSKHCLKNHPYHEQALTLTENYMTKFDKTCHFSFTFLTDISHDDPSRMEVSDDYLYAMLNRLYMNNRLNNTVFVIMGDHGNRISTIRYSYIGKFEEKLPFFAVYFPDWFKEQNPDLIRNFRINRQRLTSNYDVWQMLKEITSGSWKRYRIREKGKGLSLLRPIPEKRTCKEANIPEQYCTCLVRERMIKTDSNYSKQVEKTLKTWIKTNISCYSESWQFETVEIKMLTQTQMVGHGIRYQDKASLKKLNAKIFMDIYYFEIVTIIKSQERINVKVIARIKHQVNDDNYSMNGTPLILEGYPTNCLWAKTIEDYCNCIS